MGRRRHQRIKCDSKTSFQHIRDEPIEKGRICFKTRIGVNFNEPRFEVSIKHEIEAKKLEVRRFSFKIDGAIAGEEDIIYD